MERSATPSWCLQRRASRLPSMPIIPVFGICTATSCGIWPPAWRRSSSTRRDPRDAVERRGSDRKLSMLRNAIFVIVWMGACLLAASYPAPGQQTTTANQVSTPPKFGCRHRADPHRRRHSCDDVDFGLDETLGGGWKEIRRATQRVGITPTASYIGALQTNVTGGHDQVWSYAGLFSLAASVDFSELIKARGLSAYVGISWGTGSDLTSSLDSTVELSRL